MTTLKNRYFTNIEVSYKMRRHSTYSMFKHIFMMIALLMLSAQVALAQTISNDDIKETLDFNAGTVAYSLSAASLPNGSTLTWTIDGKTVTDGLSADGKTLTVTLSKTTRNATVTVTPADGEAQTVKFSIEPKSYGADYDGQHFYADQFASGDGTKDNPYLISNDMELALLAHRVNSGSSEQMLSGTYFKLSKDINLGRGVWTPIGTWNVNSKDAKTRRFFAGKFDGDGHTISNMQIEWTNVNNNEASWGLFSRLYGKAANENGYATVTNLVIENACVEKKKDYTPAAGTMKIGVLAGDLTDNAEISNIIIHDSKVTDNGETYSTAGKYRMGGIVGYLDGKRYKIYNISANTEMNMLKNARVNHDVTISAGIGCASSFKADNAILPTNIYVYGQAIVTSTSSRVRKGGVVAMYSSAYKLTADQQKTLYYSPTLKQTGSNIDNYGSQQDIASFGLAFATQCNDYISDKKIDKKMWSYFSGNERFSFSSFMLKLERGSSDVLTVVDQADQVSKESYDWYVSYDNVNWEKLNTEPCSSYTLPRKNYSQYVYAILPDATLRTNTTMVKSITVSAIIDSKTKPGTFIVHVSNDTEVSNEALGLTVSYEWYQGTEQLTGEKDSTYTRPSTAKETDQYNCHVTVKSGDLTLLDKWFSTTTVVYLKPSDTDGTSENDRMASDDWGYSPDKPMTTWKGAYSKLSPYASWSENYIVLIGESGDSVTNDSKWGFNIAPNYQVVSNQNFTSTDWNNVVDSNSPLFRNATITGKWEGQEDNEGIIQISGDNIGLPLWGDTRFQNITFKRGKKYYSIIYCQYHNLEMGKGIKMTGYNQVLPGYGSIDGAVTNAFHIFGGFLNDARFAPFNSKENIEAFENSMPHGREGFKITVKSGFYSCICAGGRQISDNNTTNDIVTKQNGVMGTPNMPVKCTIDIDIDSVWNNANNEKRVFEQSSTYNGQYRNNDYDIGIILAGNHEGAMYADVDINIRSGRVARVVNGTLGSQHNTMLKYPATNGKDYRVPDNTFMGRANITIDPASSENYTSEEDVDKRVVITELYGGSTGRGQAEGITVNNPFYGYSTITINGGTFKILPGTENQKKTIFSGIYGAGAGGMNGIGNDKTHTPDISIPYWNADKTVMLYGPYADAKDKLIKYHCYNANDNTYTDVDPTETNTKIVINGGKFGLSDDPIDGIYAGGSGYMSSGLWTVKTPKPSVNGGNIYGSEDGNVSTLTINGGEFYCKNGIFAGGRGTEYYYQQNPYGGTASEYTDLGKTYGNVELDIHDGIFHCPVYGGGYGVADAKLYEKDATTTTISTLSNMAKIYGRSTVNIYGGTFYQNIYGGGDMALIEYQGDDNATTVNIYDHADIRGSVFAGGNGRPYRPATSTTINDDTQSPDIVGRVIGNTSVSFSGSTELAPYIYGDIYGGGNLAQVEGNTHVNLYAGHFAGQVFGGGNGLLNDDKSVRNSADVLGNTFVMLAEDQGNQEDDDSGKKVDNFSINVIWDKMWDADNNQFYVWDTDAKSRNTEGRAAEEPIVIDKTKFFDEDEDKFINPHNIYGGGNLACKVGTYTTDENGNETGTLTEGTGLATVIVQKGTTPYELLKTQEWKLSYSDNDNPHFSVFGGGYGADTKVGSTNVTVNVEGDYGIYDAEADDNDEQLAKDHDNTLFGDDEEESSSSDGVSTPVARKKQSRRARKSAPAKNSTTIPVFDNSKGIPNFTILAVLGGGYSGTVTDSTEVTVDGQTFIHRVYGGGFGNPESTADNTTGQIGGNTKVNVKGAHVYGDVFGGGAGVAPETASDAPFANVARVLGTTKVVVSDDALVYGNVYGGGDIANVGEYQETKPDGYYDQSKLSSVSTLDQTLNTSTSGTQIGYEAKGYRSFVNIIGGDIFGQVFGGGRGLKKAQSAHYDMMGRINGNALVHVANTLYGKEFTSQIITGDGTTIPYIWNRIYGGCAYGTVDGNTLVHIEGGMLGLNIFGGGYGDVKISDDLIEKDREGINSGASTDSEILKLVLGKKDSGNEATYANVLGNTKVQIDGGSWIWNRKADINGNITTWTAADASNGKVCENYREFRQMMLALNDPSAADASTLQKVYDIISKIQNDESTREFFDISTYSFKKNNNIFGGGNRACYVGTYTGGTPDNPLTGSVKEGTGTAVVEINHSPLTELEDTKGELINLLDNTTLLGFCWTLGNNNISHPQFSVFGAGYGANTKVAKTEVYMRPGAITSSEGNSAMEIEGKRYRYINQRADMSVYAAFESKLHEDFQTVSSDDRKRYYGSADGSDSDPKTFLRYRASRWAWSLGVPNFSFMEVHGGGFSGYVLGDTYVETDCEPTCHNIYGAGLGAKPYGTITADGNYDFGSIGGSAKVFIKSGSVANNVYGGGAGVESATNNDGKLIDFPKMALVSGKTEVHVYGETITNEGTQIERTQIFGNVYGGGDVANVGTKEAEPKEFTHDDVYVNNLIDRTSLVNIRGGAIYSQVFAGGKGRTKAACADYKQLGGIYGNAYLILDRPVINYPYCDLTTGISYNPSGDGNLKHPADDKNPNIKPYLFNRIYGGCENGTIYGNTLVAVNDGYISHNIFGGGWGNCDTTYVNSVAVIDTTSADVTGNTNMIISGGKALLTSYWLMDKRFWEPASIIDGITYSPQYNHLTRKFKINHNIYAGGNEVCVVGKKDKDGNLNGSGNTYLTMVKGLLYDDIQVVPGIADPNKNFFESDEWKEVYNKVGSPHFCVFGGGYGENTNVLGDTHLNIEMSERGSLSDYDIKEGEEYKHFVSGYSVMDFVGGGYSGKVEGDTHISGNGGGFCRRVFGGGFYNSVNATNVDIKAIDCHDVFGGGLMGDVLKSTKVNIGSNEDTSSSTFKNSDIYIHGNIYGGNDVSGYVNVELDANGYFKDNGGTGTHINIYGGRIDGNVYGAGNGDYLYALDKKGNTKVTVNEDYPFNPNDPNSETESLVYTVPMRDNMPSYKAASDAAKIVNINSWRPLTDKVNIMIKGVSATDTVYIKGDVYGGGNSATVQKVQNAYARTNVTTGAITIDIGNHTRIGRVFMGCNGDALFTASEDNDFMNKFQRLNGDVDDYTKELNLADSIDWVNDPSNKGISTLWLSTKNEERPLVYPHLLDLYFQPVETNIQGTILWNSTKDGEGLEDCVIGTFCCGGNRGNMNVYPVTLNDITDDEGEEEPMFGNVFEYTFPAGLTITDKIIGGCNNANYNYKDIVSHEGGYLLGHAYSEHPFIILNINNKFKPAEKNGAYMGGNVYGGCYKTGTVRGDVAINLKSDMLEGKSKAMLRKSNELIATNPDYSALNVYGAGYGMESYVYGNTHIKMAKDVACKAPSLSSTEFEPTGTSANFIYGGGQQGNVIGVTNVEIFNGHVFKSVTGGSYSGYVWGSTQVKVGYPKYYEVQTNASGIYRLKRADQNNLDIDKGKDVASETIKQEIHLVTGDIVSQGVYDEIVGKFNPQANKFEDITVINDGYPLKDAYFAEVTTDAPAHWDDININIGDAVYGGGYSLAQGSSVMANNTTVLKYTSTYNIDNVINNEDFEQQNLKYLPNGTTVGFGGNTTILIADTTVTKGGSVDRDHITISSQSMKEATIADGEDLLGYYYKDKNNAYHYIYQAGKYFKGGNLPDNINETDHNIYEYDNEGGVFGDGHLSYAQGFRSADLTGYGFASATVESPKIINTFQRMDILRLTDNCFSLLGARDYATNGWDKTPYSISRVGEIQMVTNDVVTTDRAADAANNITAATGVLADNTTKRARNYMGLANNIHYVGALTSNVAFTDEWHDGKGAPGSYGSATTYMAVKQKYIDDYFKEGANKGDGNIFEKRNDGTAKNMIGIASGYALKIQNAQEIKEGNSVKDSLYYGPVYGVIEMNLIDVREDEGGGYVYADNVHKRTATEGDDPSEADTHDVDFLETTGNFVFPYTITKGRYIVDDCFPMGYSAITDEGKTPEEGAKAHYWYVTGFNYHYNAHITGYTFNSSGSTPLLFDSNNQDGIVALSGMKPSQEVNILSWKMHKTHSDSYSCDLEKRNYDAEATDHSGNSLKGKYVLRVGAGNSLTYNATEGFSANLSMQEGLVQKDITPDKATLPSKFIDGDAKIVFQLSDNADNSTTEYYNNHLSKPCNGTLVLYAPAKQENKTTHELEDIKGRVAISRLFTKNGEEYTEVTGQLNVGTTYYYKNGETDLYQEISKDSCFYTRNETTGEYHQVQQSEVTLGDDVIYYCYLPRFYTYTVDLTIEYVKGPDINGNITVVNCALPGEWVRVKKDQVVVDADQSFSVNGYYWRIGKRHQDQETGKWEFDDATQWTKDNIHAAKGYDTFNQSDKEGTGLFAGCHYDKTEDYLDIPAYYYMNGYGIQLGVSITGLDNIFPVDMQNADQFVVHNFHRMDPHKSGINLHLAEAIIRAKIESGSFAEPRIYLSDQSDLTAFVNFIDSVGTHSNAPRYGANAQFVLQSDLTLASAAKDGAYMEDFAGTLHGNGHIINGVKAGYALFKSKEITGNVYNLGLSSGKISNKTATKDNGNKIANYHCCFEYAPTVSDDGESTPVVYRWDGTPYSNYTQEDFRLGKVAYDLNEYYLRARHRASINTDAVTKEDTDILKYVYDYYANGDYQYACRKDDITGNNTGITYIRTGKNSDIPNYEQAETRHDKTHPVDKARLKSSSSDETSSSDGVSTPVAYEPLFNANHAGADLMNDFLFWGQSLQSEPAAMPSVIASHQLNYMTNRVFRTAGYYGDTALSTFHYNAYSYDNRSMSTYVHAPSTTAIDFTCQNDIAAATGMKGSIFYPPVNDNATKFNDFIVKDDADITHNLLVYTASNNEADMNEAYDVVSKALNYGETSKEENIKGHHIVNGGDKFSTDLFHLVERTPNNEDSEGATCYNNNLCVPIPFDVDKRAWYTRKPLCYAESSKGAWEGICLPFTADRVEASLNGEITHFYGSPSNDETDNPKRNIHTLHHEYWLRGLMTVDLENNVPAAAFQRPGTAQEGLFAPTDAEGTTLCKGVNYTYTNRFFINTYEDWLYNKDENPYYAAESHEYPGYLRLTAEVPYIVRFPGSQYYEFDLSSEFYNNIFGTREANQTITFNAYGTGSGNSASNGSVTIPVTTDMTTTVSGGYAHRGTFAATKVTTGDIYGINSDGTAFDDASTLSTVTPFRTYMVPAASGAKTRSANHSVINIAELKGGEIMPDIKDNGDDDSSNYLIVRPIGNQQVCIESTVATRLHVVTLAGQLYRILDVQPGTATYSGFYPGLYIFGKTKVAVK